MIFIASDHAGFILKSFVKQWLETHGYEVCDLGVESESRVDYPDYAKLLCQKLLEANAKSKLDSRTESSTTPAMNASPQSNQGILICGSGIGMSMSANRFPGIRAALCTSAYMAHITRAHNNANVLCLGARISGEGEVESMLEAFFTTEFEGGRHSCRVGKIEAEIIKKD